jgi:predicted secreted protein
MTITGALVVFTLGWWISFFVVLPIGVRGQFEDGEPVPGTEEGAPSKPMLAKKALWATGGGLLITILAAIIIPRFFSP